MKSSRTGRSKARQSPGVRRFNDRPLDPDYRGPVHVWDIDQTYLETDHESLRGLLRIPFEAAVDKRSVPAAAALLREVRHGPGEDAAQIPLHFVSASPPQLRRVIQRKMLLDGVDYDGIAFKDQLWWVAHGRLRGLKHHTLYKLTALFLLYLDLPPGTELLLYGDSSEDDSDIYATFDEVTGGGTSPRELESRLRREGVKADELRRLMGLVDRVEPRETVTRVYIRLVRDEDPAAVEGRSPKILGCRTPLTAALDLAERGMVRPSAVRRVAKALRSEGGLEEGALKAMVEQDLDRGVASRQIGELVGLG